MHVLSRDNAHSKPKVWIGGSPVNIVVQAPTKRAIFCRPSSQGILRRTWGGYCTGSFVSGVAGGENFQNRGLTRKKKENGEKKKITNTTAGDSDETRVRSTLHRRCRGQLQSRGGKKRQQPASPRRSGNNRSLEPASRTSTLRQSPKSLRIPSPRRRTRTPRCHTKNLKGKFIWKFDAHNLSGVKTLVFSSL